MLVFMKDGTYIIMVKPQIVLEKQRLKSNGTYFPKLHKRINII